MASKVKTSAAAVQVPQSREEATETIARIGRLRRDVQDIEVRMNDELSAVKQRWEEKAQPIGLEIDALVAGLQIWADANRRDLTQDGKTKTAQLPSGAIHWRMTPPKVTVRGADVVMQALKERGLVRFIRTIEELNKEAILADPEAVAGIKGLTIGQKEEFIVEPFEAKIEAVAS